MREKERDFEKDRENSRKNPIKEGSKKMNSLGNKDSKSKRKNGRGKDPNEAKENKEGQ